MGLRDIAEEDLALTLEDDVDGFGFPFTLVAPDGQEENFTGQTGDIAQIVDPETGIVVSGRRAHVAVRISSFETAFGGGPSAYPVGIADKTIKPWLVIWNDIRGHAYTFKVSKSNPDRTLGIITLILEAYKQ